MDVSKIRPELVRVAPSDDFLWRELSEAQSKKPDGAEQDMEPGVEPPEEQGIALHRGETVTVSRMIGPGTMREFMTYYDALREESDGGKILAAIEAVCAPLSEQIIAWTWTHPITGEPLPQPYRNPQVIASLDVPHIQYLLGLAIGAATKNPPKS